MGLSQNPMGCLNRPHYLRLCDALNMLLTRIWNPGVVLICSAQPHQFVLSGKHQNSCMHRLDCVSKQTVTGWMHPDAFISLLADYDTSKLVGVRCKNSLTSLILMNLAVPECLTSLLRNVLNKDQSRGKFHCRNLEHNIIMGKKHLHGRSLEVSF